MAFKPSYNIMDRDTHNALVNAFKTGGIGYTDDDGSVHKIADDYVSGGGGGGSIFYVEIVQGDTITLNKTFNEIKAAYDANSLIMFRSYQEQEGLFELIISPLSILANAGGFIAGYGGTDVSTATLFTASAADELMVLYSQT